MTTIIPIHRRGGPVKFSLVRFSVLGCLLSSSVAHAWGDEGHKIIARMAELRLEKSPAVLAELRSIIAADTKPFPSDAQLEPAERGPLTRVSMWADLVKSRVEGNGTGGWHYTSLDYSETKSSVDFDAACSNDASFSYDENGTKYEKPIKVPATDNCTVKQLPTTLNTLANKKAPKTSRLNALKFLVHLMGDLHCPMHMVGWQDDMGGNQRPVAFFGDPDSPWGPLSLHSVWDNNIIEKLARDRAASPGDKNYLMMSTAQPMYPPKPGAPTTRTIVNIDHWANVLNSTWGSASVTSIMKGDYESWGWDAHTLGVKVAYAASSDSDWLMPKGTKTLTAEEEKKRVVLDEDYFRKAATTTERQLTLGGIRLAELLKDALK